MSGIVTYLRVSTRKQGRSGLGLEAQRAVVASFGNPIREYVEIESGKINDRPQLAAAMSLCRAMDATLCIAKLDRLSRDAHFLLGLDKAGVEFVCADMPHANRMTISIMAIMAEEERRMISARTKAALQAAKARGTVLGGYRGGVVSSKAWVASSAAVKAAAVGRANDLMPIIRELREEGIVTLNGLARALSDRAVPKARGGLSWSAMDVRNVLVRLI